MVVVGLTAVGMRISMAVAAAGAGAQERERERDGSEDQTRIPLGWSSEISVCWKAISICAA